MSEEIIKNLGPLAKLAGIWEGDKGVDTAPAAERTQAQQTMYRERMTFVPIGPVDNHEQILYGLRYSTTAWPIGDENPFHEELGYWLWCPKGSQVMRCFMVPRGSTLIAGGKVGQHATSFHLTAKVGEPTFGILSNPYLHEEFQTIRFDLDLRIENGTILTYQEDTQLKIKGMTEIFHHTDRNTLTKISSA